VLVACPCCLNKENIGTTITRGPTLPILDTRKEEKKGAMVLRLNTLEDYQYPLLIETDAELTKIHNMTDIRGGTLHNEQNDIRQLL